MIRTALRLLACLFVTFFINACGTDGDSLFQSSSSSLSYEFTSNGCSTGRHSFSTFQSLCDGLENEALNTDWNRGYACAHGLRRDHFVSQGCPGTFNPR